MDTVTKQPARWYTFVVAVLLWFCLIDTAFPNAVQAVDVKDVEMVLEKTFKCHSDRNPGMIVSVVRNGKVLLARGYGVTDLERRGNVTSDTLFNVASISKNMASALLIKLLHEKTNLTVDSKVRDLLGDKLQFIDPFRTQEMTFADVMGHRTGVPPNNIIRFDTNLTRDGLLDRLAHLTTPDQFRVKYYYNNLMYGVVTHIAEVLGKDKWENLIRKHFFAPLGMGKSTFVTEINYTRPDAAWPYVMHDGKLHVTPFEHSRRWGLLAGSVALVTTAEDMTKWMHFHLSGGQDMQGNRVMAESDLSHLHVPRMPLPSPTSDDFVKPDIPHTISKNTYTFGLRRGFYRGFTRFSHSGSNHGFRALMSLLPTEGVGVFMALTGRDDGYQYRQPLNMYLTDYALGFEPWLNASTICSYPAPWRTPKVSASTTPSTIAATRLLLPVVKYEGTYFHPAYGYLHISYESPVLLMTYGWASWRLYPRISGNRELFFAKGTNLTVAYNLDPFEFLIASDDTINSFKATGFEKSSPPIFERIGASKNGKNNDGSLIRVPILLILFSLLSRPQFFM